MNALERIGILIAVFIFCIIVWNYVSIHEGFSDANTQIRYGNLQEKLKSKLSDYCELTQFAQAQMKTMYMTANNESESAANSHIQQTYRDIYACRDDLASSRPSCRKIVADFTPCNKYINIPGWSDEDEISLTFVLLDIQNNLADKISVELDYYETMIDKLESAVNMANNPPSSPPGGDLPRISEGFINPYCLDEMRRKAMESQVTKCDALPSLDSEITRVNSILDSEALNNSISRCKSVLGRMIKLQADMDAIKRKWGDDGPQKSYTQFQGGDRIQSLLFSMQQLM